MKKLMTLAPGIVLAGSFASFPAAAQMSDDLAFDPSIYAGGSAGYFRLNNDDFLDEEDEFKDNRWAWRGLAKERATGRSLRPKTRDSWSAE